MVGCGGGYGQGPRRVPSVFLRLLPSGEINYHHHKAAHGSKERINRPVRPLVKRSGCNLNSRRKEQKNPSNYSDWGLRIFHRRILLKTIWPQTTPPRLRRCCGVVGVTFMGPWQKALWQFFAARATLRRKIPDPRTSERHRLDRAVRHVHSELQ